jgi:hypothetical protein
MPDADPEKVDTSLCPVVFKFKFIIGLSTFRQLMTYQEQKLSPQSTQSTQRSSQNFKVFSVLSVSSSERSERVVKSFKVFATPSCFTVQLALP